MRGWGRDTARAVLSGIVLSVLLAGLPAVAAAQPGPPIVAQIDALRQLLSGDRPYYPQLAQASRVEGVVYLDVVVGPDGRVTEARILAGWPWLSVPALEAVRGWVFRPFASAGVPMAVRTAVSLAFTIEAVSEEDRTAIYGLGDVLLQCRVQVEAGRDVEAEASCADAGRRAETLDDYGVGARELAMRHRAEALTGLDRPDEALAVLAPLVADRPRFANVDYGVVIHARARALAAAGDTAAALEAYREADDELQNARRLIRTDSAFFGEAAAYHRRVLSDYAGLLDQLGRPGEAADVRDRLGDLPEPTTRPG